MTDMPSSETYIPKVTRPEISPLFLNVGATLFMLAAFNNTWWGRLSGALDGHPVQMVILAGAFWALTLFVATLLGPRWLQKPVLISMVLIGAAASWYQDELGATINRDMIQNVMQTTVTEARHLVTLPYALHMLVWGVLPALAILLVRIKPLSLRRDLVIWALSVLLSFALVPGLLITDFKAFSSLLRERKDIVNAYQPLTPIVGAYRYGKMMLASAQTEVEPLGLDAQKGPLLAAARKPVVTVIFAGETARAQNWGANGYARNTSPETIAAGAINFSNVESCGTATAVSLPCMFSDLTESDFSTTRFRSRENLLDVLSHAGVKVEWIDNNTGDQGIGARTGSSRLSADADPVACAAGECTDEVFLPILREKLASITEDTVLVFHMIGSHGPAYFMRYTDDFRRFTPDCRSADFNTCTEEEIANAYDNTLLFTDHVLAQAMAELEAAQDRVAPALLFLSDHGESLGEGGLFLHGAPRFLAPEVQYKVPMEIWLSEGYRDAMGLDSACVAAQSDQPLSQDYMFHTILGMMDIRTAAHDPAHDLVAACKGPIG